MLFPFQSMPAIDQYFWQRIGIELRNTGSFQVLMD